MIRCVEQETNEAQLIEAEELCHCVVLCAWDIQARKRILFTSIVALLFAGATCRSICGDNEARANDMI